MRDIHEYIISSLLSEKLEKNNNYDINFSIIKALNPPNINFYSFTKYYPEFLFHYNTEEIGL